MKKLLKCLSLLLIVPVLSVCALTGCKDKNKGSGAREYISYKEADKILTSAYVALFGEELEPPEEPPIATPTALTTETAAAASSKDIKLIKENTFLEGVKINETDYVSNTNGEVKVNDNYYLYISGECYVPISMARQLLREGITEIVGGAIEFSYENNPDIIPSSLKCKIRVRVYDNVFSIEMRRDTESLIDTTIVNIIFDDDLNATHILYATSKTENSTDIFAFASYDLDDRTTNVLKVDETTTELQTKIKAEVTAFANKTATPNTTYDFAALYVKFT